VCWWAGNKTHLEHTIKVKMALGLLYELLGELVFEQKVSSPHLY
jgi:hypothetical protein